MEKKFKRTLITTALPYANGPVHIGHLAGVYVPADIYARYLRLKGEEVIMIGGSDEHGVPITIRAKKEGITPQDVVDRYHNIIKKSFEDFGISTTRASLSRRPASNITTKRHSNSWPTAILQALALIAATNMRMATNARRAGRRLVRRTLLIRSRPSVEVSR